MTFVVTENCIKCKYTDCVEVCPVDCFNEGPNFLVIDVRLRRFSLKTTSRRARSNSLH